MIRPVYVTDESWPASPELIATAQGREILHGIPRSLEHLIPAGTLGPLDLELPDPPAEPTPELSAAGEAVQVIAEEVDARLAPTDVNSIAELKTAVRDGLAAAVARLTT